MATNSQTQLAITLSFITTFFWLKIWFGNVKASGANRKHSPEDKIAFGKDDGTMGHGLEATSPDDDQNLKSDVGNSQPTSTFTSKDRWSNINQNDRENIPCTLFIFWGCAIIGHELTTDIVFYTSILFTIFRLAHTICYANGINPKGVPLRSLMYAFGQLTALVSAIMLPIGAVIKYA
eukprot:542624_1